MSDDASETSTRRRTASGRVDVRGTQAGWMVVAGRAGRLFATQQEAIDAARAVVRRRGGELRIHDPGGRVHASFTIGRDPFGRISAVEGITPTREALARSRDYDRRGLSPAERRAAIIEVHRPKD